MEGSQHFKHQHTPEEIERFFTDTPQHGVQSPATRLKLPIPEVATPANNSEDQEWDLLAKRLAYEAERRG